MAEWNNIDVVIPVAKSNNNHLDLRYALRSIEKFATGIGDVYLIGEKPKWATNVKHIAKTENYIDTIKERNIYEKIVRAFDFTDKMLFMNDDHVFTKPISALEYPYYHKGQIKDFSSPIGYKVTLNRTKRVLKDAGIADLNFDTHCPIIYEKDKFIKAFENLDWGVKYGYGIKSIYCGMNGISGEYMEDCKITTTFAKETITDRHIISFNDHGLKLIQSYLQEILPFKSKYEQ